MRITILSLALLAQTSSPIFRFETDGFWLNMHHFLYVLGRVEAKMPDVRREAVVNAPADEAAGLASLTEEDRRAWRDAVTFYSNGLSRQEAVFDQGLIFVTNAMRHANGARPASTLKIDPALRAALDRAALVYRKVWWAQHQEANRQWLSGMQQPLKAYGPRLLAYITRAYQEAWMQDGFPVQVSAWSNWAGAYSTAPADPLLVVSTMNAGNAGLHGFEITFHEAMHQWDEEIDARLQKIAAANNLKVNDGLSHAMIFYTTGEAMKTVVPGHVPYADVAGIWKGRFGAFKPALDAHWKPYLDGKGTLDEALLGVLKS